MKPLSFLFLPAFLLAGCSTSDYTHGQSNVCEVHQMAMFKRSVPFAHGMIPMSLVEDKRGEWKRRRDLYPHPGDCQPATDIVLPGETGKVVVYVCNKCEAAKREMAGLPILPSPGFEPWKSANRSMTRSAETDRFFLQQVSDCEGGLRRIAGHAGDGKDKVSESEIGATVRGFE